MPRQKAAESRKIPESGSVIPREGVESPFGLSRLLAQLVNDVIPREGVESLALVENEVRAVLVSDPERGS